MYDNITKNEAIEFLSQENLSLNNLTTQTTNQHKQITFSKNVFLPLTRICRNNCGYCTFRRDIKETNKLLMKKEEVLQMVHKAEQLNCTEALFTFGESADEYDEIMDILNRNKYESMVDYVYNLSKTILDNYDMLPHTNMGIISRQDLKLLSSVNASMGLMLETTNKKLLKTVAHKDSPGKDPEKRIKFIKNAGKEKIPFTTGILIGIGETVEDHVDSLMQIRKIHDKYGHIQEIIIQNFKAKEDTPMSNYPETSTEYLLKITALASQMFPDVSIQIPPNLNNNLIQDFIKCGADDLGGISPLTTDYINPETNWPQIKELEKELKQINYKLKERLPVYKKYIKREFLSEEVYEKAENLQKRIN